MRDATRRRRRGGTAFVALVAHATLTHPASCLAGIESSRGVRSVISTKKDGGLSKVFSLDTAPSDPDNTQKASHHVRGSPSAREALHQVNSALRSTFLPSGFPARTPQGYLSYSVWSWIQDLSTQLRSVLATQRVLEGVGVGREGATALSALMNFLVRDGCGMAATLVFTSAASSRFKSDVKRWRLFADIMVDLGITLEATATLLPQSLFLPMISVGNMCKAICGVAAGACGGAINLHWAKGSDISDINAKFGAQHTVTGSLGLIFAALFAKSVSTVDQTKLWTLYSLLTLLHVFANMRCMRLIAFDSFNNARMKLVVAKFLVWWEKQAEGSEGDSLTLPSPSDIAKREPLFFVGSRIPRVSTHPISIGSSFNELISRTGRSSELLETIQQQSVEESRYLVRAGVSQRGRASIVICFFGRVDPRDQAKAYFHAILLGRELKRIDSRESESIAVAQRSTDEILPRAWKAFEQSCETAGWDLAKTELRSKGFELEVKVD